MLDAYVPSAKVGVLSCVHGMDRLSRLFEELHLGQQVVSSNPIIVVCT